MHIHVYAPDGEAKFWIEPTIELASQKGLSVSDLREINNQIKAHEDEIREKWKQHFGGTA